jgi:uncharacterized protein (TIGR00299 family) protein
MLLGALVGAGADIEVISGAVETLGIGVRLSVATVIRAGIAATKVDVHPDPTAPRPRRTWSNIRKLIDDAPLSQGIRDRALATFAALACAEARVHGTDVEDVHFHEVGAVDALADVVGVCAALESLGLNWLVASPIAVGGGSARTEHGVLPVPVPAVLELLAQAEAPAFGGPVDVELCTPTGAALVTTVVDGYGPLPVMCVRAVGLGAGARDLPGRPNVVRLVVGDPPNMDPTDVPELEEKREKSHGHGMTDAHSAVEVGGAAGVTEAVGATEGTEATDIGDVHDEVLLETNIDDLDPRVWPEVLAVLLRAGASDAWLTPILMKKGRPAHTLSVLTATDRVAAVRALVFRHTSTLGLREITLSKHALRRGFHTVNVDGQPVRVKTGRLPGGDVVTSQPEWDDVERAAGALGRPARTVLATAQAAALAEQTGPTE